MSELFYTTGQAARELGCGQARVRNLCIAKLIQADETAGGQWRIPQAEVERLKRVGLPPSPRPLPDGAVVRSPSGHRAGRANHPGLLAEPSTSVVESAESVVKLENEVKGLGLRKQKEEHLDFFRGREARDAARKAEREAEEMRRHEEAEQAYARQAWEEAWTDHGLSEIPPDAPDALRLDVHAAIQGALSRLSPTSPASTTTQLVNAAVAAALAPWRSRLQIEDVTERCSKWSGVPWLIQSEWAERAADAIRAALNLLPPTASLAELERAAKKSIEPIIVDYHFQKRCTAILESPMWDATTEERERARELAQAAVAKLNPTASDREIQATYDNAVRPILARITDRENRKQDTAERDKLISNLSWSFPFDLPTECREDLVEELREEFEDLPVGTSTLDLAKVRDRVVAKAKRLSELVKIGLDVIPHYVRHLAREFEDVSESDVSTLTIKNALYDEIDGSESRGQVEKLARRLVREQLDIDDSD